MKYSLKNATDDSVESLCALFLDVFQQQIEPSQWRWKYHDPALLGHENVMLCDETGAVIGHAGAILLPGSVGGRSVPVAQICDVMLAKEARGHAGPTGGYAAFMSALFSQLQQRIPEGLYYGFPGKRPFRLGERLGFYRGTGPIFESRVPVTALHHARWPWWRLEELDWQDPRIDRLWLDRAACHSGIVVLDRRYLDWRYRRNPVHRYRLLGIHAGLRLVGWVVVTRHEDVLRCIERLLDESHIDAVLGLLARTGRATGARELAWWADASAAAPTAASLIDTHIIGTVVTASAPQFASTHPFWQPGNVDIY